MALFTCRPAFNLGFRFELVTADGGTRPSVAPPEQQHPAATEADTRRVGTQRATVLEAQAGPGQASSANPDRGRLAARLSELQGVVADGPAATGQAAGQDSGTTCVHGVLFGVKLMTGAKGRPIADVVHTMGRFAGVPEGGAPEQQESTTVSCGTAQAAAEALKRHLQQHLEQRQGCGGATVDVTAVSQHHQLHTTQTQHGRYTATAATLTIKVMPASQLFDAFPALVNAPLLVVECTVHWRFGALQPQPKCEPSGAPQGQPVAVVCRTTEKVALGPAVLANREALTPMLAALGVAQPTGGGTSWSAVPSNALAAAAAQQLHDRGEPQPRVLPKERAPGTGGVAGPAVQSAQAYVGRMASAARSEEVQQMSVFGKGTASGASTQLVPMTREAAAWITRPGFLPATVTLYGPPAQAGAGQGPVLLIIGLQLAQPLVGAGWYATPVSGGVGAVVVEPCRAAELLASIASAQQEGMGPLACMTGDGSLLVVTGGPDAGSAMFTLHRPGQARPMGFDMPDVKRDAGVVGGLAELVRGAFAVGPRADELYTLAHPQAKQRAGTGWGLWLLHPSCAARTCCVALAARREGWAKPAQVTTTNQHGAFEQVHVLGVYPRTAPPSAPARGGARGGAGGPVVPAALPQPSAAHYLVSIGTGRPLAVVGRDEPAAVESEAKQLALAAAPNMTARGMDQRRESNSPPAMWAWVDAAAQPPGGVVGPALGAPPAAPAGGAAEEMDEEQAEDARLLEELQHEAQRQAEVEQNARQRIERAAENRAAKASKLASGSSPAAPAAGGGGGGGAGKSNGASTPMDTTK